MVYHGNTNIMMYDGNLSSGILYHSKIMVNDGNTILHVHVDWGLNCLKLYFYTMVVDGIPWYYTMYIGFPWYLMVYQGI